MPNRKARPMRRHLYLVLDDWSRGYTIREIDLLPDPLPSYPGRQILIRQNLTGGFLGKQSLPPPIIRVEEARGLPTCLVASGRHLMFMQLSDRQDSPQIFPILDVPMRSTSFCRLLSNFPVLPIHFRPPPPVDSPVDVIYIPAGGNIYTLDPKYFGVLSPGPDNFHLEPGTQPGTRTHNFNLEPGNLQKTWLWSMLPNPPFELKHVISYASRSGALFFQTKVNDCVSTFTFNMMEDRWDQKDMLMPFIGQTHFDPVLDAFVGLSELADSIGHICVVYMDGSRKLSKEKLFSKDNPAEFQAGSTLVCMGGRSNFCLVECISHDQTNGNIIVETGTSYSKLGDRDVSGHSCYLFRLTPFFLKYDKNGDLRIVNLPVQYYNVPRGVTESALKNPAAFWL